MRTNVEGSVKLIGCLIYYHIFLKFACHSYSVWRHLPPCAMSYRLLTLVPTWQSSRMPPNILPQLWMNTKCKQNNTRLPTILPPCVQGPSKN